MFRIFITADVAKEAKEILEKEFIVDIQPNMKEEELCQVIGDYDAIITRSQTKVTKAVIDAAKNLKVIGRAGVGIDGIDIAEGHHRREYAGIEYDRSLRAHHRPHALHDPSYPTGTPVHHGRPLGQKELHRHPAPE